MKKLLPFLWITILPLSCVVRGYTYDAFYEEKTDLHASGYTVVSEPCYWMNVDGNKDYLSIFLLTRFNAPHIVQDTISTLHFTGFIPCLDNGDTLVRDTTAPSEFHYISTKGEKITSHRELRLTVLYDCDSAGRHSSVKRQYVLHRRSHYWLAVH